MSRIAKVGTLALGAGAVVLGLPGVAAADADAKAAAYNSSGYLSGNVIQVPIHAPINVCGNTVTGLGGLNRATGSVCENNEGEKKNHKKHESRAKHDKKHANKQHKAHDNKSVKKDDKAHDDKQHKAHEDKKDVKKDVKKHADKQHKAHADKHDKKHDKKDVKKHAVKLLQGYGL